MSFPSFATGEVLTAADMNAVGLWLVKTQTVGSTAVPSVTVTGAFSSQYDNYIVTWQGGTMSADTALKFRLGSNTNNCFGAFIHAPNYLASSVVNVGDNNTAFFTYAGGGNSGGAHSYLYIQGPNKPTRTYINSGLINYSTTFGTYVGSNFNTTQFTDFTFEPFSGTMVDGTIRVYGMRN
jgi:hypothetical protein